MKLWEGSMRKLPKASFLVVLGWALVQSCTNVGLGSIMISYKKKIISKFDFSQKWTLVAWSSRIEGEFEGGTQKQWRIEVKVGQALVTHHWQRRRHWCAALHPACTGQTKVGRPPLTKNTGKTWRNQRENSLLDKYSSNHEQYLRCIKI